MSPFFTEIITSISNSSINKIWSKMSSSARFGGGGGKNFTKKNRERVSNGLKEYSSKEYQELFGHELTIDKKYIQELFIKQNGRCAISGMIMDDKYNLISNHPFQISVDRIDSNKGYIHGNCQLTLTFWNRAKGSCDLETWKLIEEQVFNK
jgi:hypothetical protein